MARGTARRSPRRVTASRSCPSRTASRWGAMRRSRTASGRRIPRGRSIDRWERRWVQRRFAALARARAPAGMLWISWAKKSSGVTTDRTEDVIRAIGLAHGLVDVKVAAVDEVWSGLKFVRRVKDR